MVKPSKSCDVLGDHVLGWDCRFDGHQPVRIVTILEINSNKDFLNFERNNIPKKLIIDAKA